MKLTLDTNVLLDAAGRPNGEAFRKPAIKLLELSEKGFCELYRTTRVDVDLKPGPLRERIIALPEIRPKPAGAPFRVDYSELDSGDYLVGDDQMQDEERLRAVVFPGIPEAGKKECSRKADLDHLHAHKASDNDVFVTRDGPILDAKEALKQQFDIVVMSPREALAALGHSNP